MLVVGRTHLIMSDFPELRLLDEVQDLATSSDFFAFTRDQFNRAWEDESSSRDDDSSSSDDHSTVGLWQTPERGQQPEWGRDLYERNLWDPMLCDGFRTGTAGTDAELFDASQQQHEEDRRCPVTCEEMAEDDDDEYSGAVMLDVAPITLEEPKLWTGPDFPAKIEQRMLDKPATNTLITLSHIINVETCLEGSNRLSLSKPMRCHRGGSNLVKQPSPRSLKSRFFPLKQRQTTRRRSRGGVRKSAGQKTKLYEMPQFPDLSKERCRQNAINSKINRDRKKMLLCEAESTISSLKTMNRRLVREAVSGRQRLLAARQEIQLLKKQLALDD